MLLYEEQTLESGPVVSIRPTLRSKWEDFRSRGERAEANPTGTKGMAKRHTSQRRNAAKPSAPSVPAAGSSELAIRHEKPVQILKPLKTHHAEFGADEGKTVQGKLRNSAEKPMQIAEIQSQKVTATGDGEDASPSPFQNERADVSSSVALESHSSTASKVETVANYCASKASGSGEIDTIEHAAGSVVGTSNNTATQDSTTKASSAKGPKSKKRKKAVTLTTSSLGPSLNLADTVAYPKLEKPKQAITSKKSDAEASSATEHKRTTSIFSEAEITERKKAWNKIAMPLNLQQGANERGSLPAVGSMRKESKSKL